MGEMKQKSRRKQQRRRVQSYKRSMLAVSGVIVLLTIVLFANALTLRAKEQSYQAQEAELKEQIQEEKARTSEIDDLEEYVGTDEYVEEIAREKLGLVHEDEIIFKAK